MHVDDLIYELAEALANEAGLRDPARDNPARDELIEAWVVRLRNVTTEPPEPAA
jgi:hypothetical protein